MRIRAKSAGITSIEDKDRVVLNRVDLVEADFASRKMVQFSATGSRFVGCRFDRAQIGSAAFGAGTEPSEYVNCSFDGAHIRFGPGGLARFEACSFSGVNLRDWFCFAVELVDCRFSGRMTRAFFNGTVPDDKRTVVGRSHNEFRSNDFSQMTLENVAFRTGVDLTQQRLPPGAEYVYLPDAEQALRRARAQVVRWEDLAARRDAMVLIQILDEDVAGGQQQLFLRRDDYKTLGKDAVDEVFELLTATSR